MHDKSQTPVDRAFALSAHHIIALTGRDAASFSQSQFMNDLNGLQTGHWHWNGWLTPKGRLLALFALLKWSEQEIWLLIPDADPAALADGLRRFLFRSKVTIEVREDLQVAGAFAAPAGARGNAFFDGGTSGVELDLGGEDGPRYLRIAPHATTADSGLRDDTLEAGWQLFDLEHGLPRLSDVQVERWTPQQLSLERLQGFSVKKGCYPGQEIVARTHFLGKAKRGLTLLESDAAVDSGAGVRGDETPLGTVIASADAGGRHVALAVVSLGRDDRNLSVGTQDVRALRIKDGLAR